MRWQRLLPAVLIAAGACTGAPTDEATQPLSKLPQPANNYSLFETLQTRPLAISPGGQYLFAANTPDNKLEIYKITSGSLSYVASVAVGLEPVAVAARTDSEVWVVNHLSDSVSIVSIGNGASSRTVRTLLVGDEPRDIVFANGKAFITTAHRGQTGADLYNDPYDLQTPAALAKPPALGGKGLPQPLDANGKPIGRADVWVFDAANPGDAAAGNRLAKLTMFADSPRALAASADGKTVYAAAFYSGNMTTTVSPEAVKLVYAGANPTPGYPQQYQPNVGMVVKNIGGHWLDQNGMNFDAYVRVVLPDNDVFAIDTSALTVTKAIQHVGTTLFNMAVNPKNGKVYVTNTEARNHVRFEGTSPFGGVRGHITDSRITVIDPSSGSVAPRLLNTHIDYTQEGNPAEKALSVAFPQDVAVSKDGAKLYTVAQGSSKLAIYDTAVLEAGNPAPSLSNQVVLSGGGPTGVALDEVNNRAYVLTRFDNSIAIVDLGQKKEVKKVAMFNPEPPSVTAGRKYLYDANLTSQHGDTACASCHIGGDLDALAWDLGNPGGGFLTMVQQPDLFTIAPLSITTLLPFTAPIFKANVPLKGPMTTQSLRGMDNHGAMHWRGDRNGAVNQDGTFAVDITNGSAQPNTGFYDEVKAFTSFNVAFPGLVGAASQLSSSDMLDFATFILQQMYPPNPIRHLDDSLTAEQQHGRDFYFAHVPGSDTQLPSDRFHNCNGCHTLDPAGNKQFGVAHPGFFGSDGKLSFEFETQIFKVPHLRNMYTKVGMFGSSPDSLQPGTIILQTNPADGSGIMTLSTRGFGYNHDGVLGQLEHFFTGQVFLRTENPVTLSTGQTVPPNPYGIQFFEPSGLFASPPQLIPVFDKFTGGDPAGFQLRHDIVAFMMAFDSNFKPIVGQQITLTLANAATAAPRIALLEAQAALGNCDLVVKGGNLRGADVGYLFVNGAFQSDRTTVAPLSDASLQGLVTSGKAQALTFTCAPPGSGYRIAIDRDGDGWADGDELALGYDPANAASHP